MFTITPQASERIKGLLALDGTPGLRLRVYIMGGGCSGFKYGFSFEATQLENDVERLDDPAAPVCIDPISWQYLKDAQLDYVSDLEGARFVVNNPNVKTVCHCGHSFGF